MKLSKQLLACGAAMTVVVVACTPSGSQGLAHGPEADAQAPIKRITASVQGEPTGFIARVNPAQITPPGATSIEQLVDAALSETNGEGKLQAQLAEAVPSIENGLWKLLPDGHMETTWKIRGGARWHDGAPFTADDLVFTTTIDRDPDLPILRPTGYAFVESVQAPDAQTVVVRWNRPYIDAATMFSAGGSPAFATPLPKHLLGDIYLSDKGRLPTLPYWNEEYVGTGPFRLRELVPGASIRLQAYDDYVLGRPKIDEIEVRIILDLNTLVTNLVSGTVELTIGRGFAFEQALQLRDQWQEGRMLYTPRAWIAIHPQFISPSPDVVTDQQFRRALMYGTNRQELVDTLQGGVAAVAHLYLPPSEPEFAEVEDSVVRYEYDPRRAAQLIEGLGYTRGPDGTYRDGTNQRLAVEVRSNGERITENTIVPVANFWTRLGVATEPALVPPQRITDREYVATFPSFRMMRQPNNASQLNRLHSSLTPLAENRFVGSNYARYVSPEFDGLIDRFLTTIPRGDRIQVLRQAMRYISENLNLMGLFYDGDFVFASNRLRNVTATETQLWEVHLWDAQS